MPDNITHRLIVDCLINIGSEIFTLSRLMKVAGGKDKYDLVKQDCTEFMNLLIDHVCDTVEPKELQRFAEAMRIDKGS